MYFALSEISYDGPHVFAQSFIRQRRQSTAAQTTVRRSCGLPRCGFTLIELLVVISILVIVTTMTVMTVNFSMSSERIRSSARQIQSYLEGARDRAIYAKEPRGVRFLLDQTGTTDPVTNQAIRRTVSSLVFIGPSDPWTVGLVRLERRDADNNDQADNPDIKVLRGDGTNTQWNTLLDRKLLINGLRIKIPRGKDGSWYTVDTGLLGPSPPDNPSQNEILLLTTPYRDPGSSLSTDHVIAFEGGGPSTYSLELPPAILPNQEPVLLPRGIVIDLDGSDIPDSWRPIPPILPLPVPPPPIVYSSRMDIMFSPRGTVIGAPAARGLLHFYLAEQVDVDTLQLPPFNRAINRDNTTGPLVPAGTFANVEDPVGDRLIVTLFTQTGNISTHPVYPADGEDLNGNGVLDDGEDANTNNTLDGTDKYADDPFLYAEKGEVAGQ